MSARFSAAQAAEAHFTRMWRLQRMDRGELGALFAGPLEETLAWVESAARYGVTEAQLRLGQMLLDAKDEARALRWFKQAAKASPEAMNMVGRCLENGWGAPVDLEAAADWYRRSAEAGDDWGQYNYANMLFDGRGAPCDPAQAVAGYRLASAQGHARAMNLLARCHEEGWGTPRDPAAAYAWYRRSAEAGYFRAQFNLGSILAGRGGVEEALGWFDKACRGATPDSLPGMVDALLGQSDPAIAGFGRQIAQDLGVAEGSIA